MLHDLLVGDQAALNLILSFFSEEELQSSLLLTCKLFYSIITTTSTANTLSPSSQEHKQQQSSTLAAAAAAFHSATHLQIRGTHSRKFFERLTCGPFYRNYAQLLRKLELYECAEFVLPLCTLFKDQLHELTISDKRALHLLALPVVANNINSSNTSISFLKFGSQLRRVKLTLQLQLATQFETAQGLFMIQQLSTIFDTTSLTHLTISDTQSNIFLSPHIIFDIAHAVAPFKAQLQEFSLLNVKVASWEHFIEKMQDNGMLHTVKELSIASICSSMDSQLLKCAPYLQKATIQAIPAYSIQCAAQTTAISEALRLHFHKLTELSLVKLPCEALHSILLQLPLQLKHLMVEDINIATTTSNANEDETLVEFEQTLQDKATNTQQHAITPPLDLSYLNKLQTLTLLQCRIDCVDNDNVQVLTKETLPQSIIKLSTQCLKRVTINLATGKNYTCRVPHKLAAVIPKLYSITKNNAGKDEYETLPALFANNDLQQVKIEFDSKLKSINQEMRHHWHNNVELLILRAVPNVPINENEFEIWHLKKLSKLYIHEMPHFQQLSSKIGSALLHLETLSLEQCQLTSFPEAIFSLKALQYLHLGYNSIVTIPEVFLKGHVLQQLKEIRINNNKIGSDGQFITFEHFPRLQEVWMRNNSFSSSNSLDSFISRGFATSMDDLCTAINRHFFKSLNPCCYMTEMLTAAMNNDSLTSTTSTNILQAIQAANSKKQPIISVLGSCVEQVVPMHGNTFLLQLHVLLGQVNAKNNKSTSTRGYLIVKALKQSDNDSIAPSCFELPVVLYYRGREQTTAQNQFFGSKFTTVAQLL